jgi:hypothetical protein
MPMHIHLIAHAVGIATVLLILAYFILVAAQRSVGFVSGLGTLLAIWLFVIAGVVVAGAVTAPMFGGKPFGLDMPPGRWMHPDGQVLPAPPPSEPAPTQPEPAPAPAPAPAPSGG